MEMKGIFWIAIILMSVVAFGFVGLPLLKTKRNAIVIALAVLIPLIAATLYVQLGSPSANDAGVAAHQANNSTEGARTAAPDSKLGSVASMVDGLAARLQENPDDAGSWLLLARSYKHLNRTQDALDAYAHAEALGEHDAELAALRAADPADASTGAQVFGNVTLSADVADVVQDSDTVFVFAKAVNGPPAPLAVLQRPVSDLPLDFLLNDSQSMVAGLKLSDFDEVVVTARITRGGDATVALRGLEASSGKIRISDKRHLVLSIQ